MAFIKLPDSTKKKNVKEWLKYAVAIAEKDLGSGTGQLKLRKVYDMAVQEFPWIITAVSFEEFSNWVDEALVWLDKQLNENSAAKALIVG